MIITSLQMIVLLGFYNILLPCLAYRSTSSTTVKGSPATDSLLGKDGSRQELQRLRILGSSLQARWCWRRRLLPPPLVRAACAALWPPQLAPPQWCKEHEEEQTMEDFKDLNLAHLQKQLVYAFKFSKESPLPLSSHAAALFGLAAGVSVGSGRQQGPSMWSIKEALSRAIYVVRSTLHSRPSQLTCYDVSSFYPHT